MLSRIVRKTAVKLCCCSFLAVFGVAALQCGKAQAGEDTAPRYCVIVKPDVRRNVSGQTGMVKPAAVSGRFTPVTGEKNVSFFSGAIKKIGFGTPKCFFINGRVESNPLKGIQHVYTGPGSAPAPDTAELNGEEGFFPTVGYFNRVADQAKGVALGVGIGSSSTEELQEGPARPEAKVALILGFGF